MTPQVNLATADSNKLLISNLFEISNRFRNLFQEKSWGPLFFLVE